MKTKHDEYLTMAWCLGEMQTDDRTLFEARLINDSELLRKAFELKAEMDEAKLTVVEPSTCNLDSRKMKQPKTKPKFLTSLGLISAAAIFFAFIYTSKPQKTESFSEPLPIDYPGEIDLEHIEQVSIDHIQHA